METKLRHGRRQQQQQHQHQTAHKPSSGLFCLHGYWFLHLFFYQPMLLLPPGLHCTCTYHSLFIKLCPLHLNYTHLIILSYLHMFCGHIVLYCVISCKWLNNVISAVSVLLSCCSTEHQSLHQSTAVGDAKHSISQH